MENTHQPIQKRKFGFGQIGFLVLLVLNFLIELVAAISMLVFFPQALESGFGISYTPDIAVLGIALGSNLILASSILLLSVIWVWRSKMEGVLTGLLGGGFLILFGFTAFFQLGEMQALLLDGIRGVLTLLFAYLTYLELNKQSL